MKKLFLKSLPVLALAVAVWLIVRFLKPEVYDIPVPKDFSGTSNYTTVRVPDSAGQFAFSNPHIDSLTCSPGLTKSDTLKNKEMISVFSLKQNHLPLEWFGEWNNGFMEVHPVNAGVNSQSAAAGLFKENYEGGEIVLRLEKKKPLRILALWENFAITGETNGELVKIRIPAAASKLRYSLIRVWSCDDKTMSPVCEIPLARGLVAGNFEKISALRADDPVAEFSRVLSTNMALDSALRAACAEGMKKITGESSELKVCLAFGDLRRQSPKSGNSGYDMLVYNYFGKKILVLLNSTNEALDLDLPVKGDFKKSLNQTNFNLKGNHLKLMLPAKRVEILY